MKTTIIGLALGAMLFALSSIIEAQPPQKVYRIGYIAGRSPSTDEEAEPIRLALRQAGYIEGQNIAIEYRYGEGRGDRAPELAAELVRLKVDIIVTGGTGGSGRPRMRPRRFPS
jgi:putative ABC transport system substrate-binding protein